MPLDGAGGGLRATSRLMPVRNNSLDGTTQLLPLSYAPFSDPRPAGPPDERELPALSRLEQPALSIASPTDRPSGRWMDTEQALSSESHLVPNPTLRQLRGRGDGSTPTPSDDLLRALGLPTSGPELSYAKVPVWMWDTRKLWNGQLELDPEAARAAEEAAARAARQQQGGGELPGESVTVPGSQLDRAAVERERALMLHSQGHVKAAKALILKAVDREEYTEEGLRAKAQRHKALALECSRVGDVDSARASLELAVQLETEAEVCGLHPSDLMQRSKVSKAQAVELKRVGDVPGALEALRISKKLEAYARRGQDPLEIAKRDALGKMEADDLEGAAKALAKWRAMLPPGPTSPVKSPAKSPAKAPVHSPVRSPSPSATPAQTQQTGGDEKGGDQDTGRTGEGRTGEGRTGEGGPDEDEDEEAKAELGRVQAQQDAALEIAELSVAGDKLHDRVAAAKRQALDKRRAGDLEGARQALETARELEAEEAIAGHRRRALERKRAGDLDGARSAMAQARELEATRLNKLKQRALDCKHAGDLAGARAALARVRKLEGREGDPTASSAARWQAAQSQARGDLGGTVTALRVVRQLQAKGKAAQELAEAERIEALKRQALDRKHAGDVHGAASALRVARVLEAQAAQRTADELARQAEALEGGAVQALPADPVQRVAQLKRDAVLAKRMGDHEGAVQLMREAVELQAAMAATDDVARQIRDLKRQALELKQQGRREEAIQALRRARDLEATL